MYISQLVRARRKDDIALLHAIHKTHKSLPPRSQSKISSLYVLDSLARGVHKLYRNASRNKDDDEKEGNKTVFYAKGFLGKVEGVLEGWARDMCDWPEGRVSRFSPSFLAEFWRGE